jgi:inorganic pyrophosphatase
MTRDPFAERVSTFATGDHVHVVVETPSGSRSKYVWDPELRAFRLSKVMPLGTVFPCDFGFVPGTDAADGDPLDALVLADEPAFPGCVIECRVLGAFTCKTSKPGSDRTTRNDRLIVVPAATIRGAAWHDLGQIGDRLVRELGEFLADYTRREGRTFELLATVDRAAALALVKAAG